MPSEDTTHHIALHEERIEVTKAEVVTDQLRVATTVDTRPILLEETVARGNLHIERIAVDWPVAQAPEPREENGTLIVSVVEERLVVEKRLFVVEELRITRTTSRERVSIAETVRTMSATVERVPPASSSTTATGRDSDG